MAWILNWSAYRTLKVDVLVSSSVVNVDVVHFVQFPFERPVANPNIYNRSNISSIYRIKRNCAHTQSKMQNQIILNENLIKIAKDHSVYFEVLHIFTCVRILHLNCQFTENVLGKRRHFSIYSYSTSPSLLPFFLISLMCVHQPRTEVLA